MLSYKSILLNTLLPDHWYHVETLYLPTSTQACTLCVNSLGQFYLLGILRE